ncbi:Fur-regulated basic protein FbpA [Pallidibacillus pasinlerensis]|uniref:Fur-regulated basic protein FbpA n=1 Tax=Pallidibacillus pasinlerensis TaxID=2703818 RepID=A0ABX0A5A9_9BACI|nr:Fur-regulated basic protein FbpA [Pallidibacillus pasinlerensis]
MTQTNRKTIAERKNKLINKLLAYNIYKKGDKHLYELSLFELEQEYKKLVNESHPHGEVKSIHVKQS